MVGRWGTLTALALKVCGRMENPSLWLQSLNLEVQYASWHKDVRLSLESYVGLKAVYHKKALEGPNVHLLHSRRVLRTIFEENCISKCISEGNQCILASNFDCWWHLRWNGNFQIFLIFAWLGEAGL